MDTLNFSLILRITLCHSDAKRIYKKFYCITGKLRKNLLITHTDYVKIYFSETKNVHTAQKYRLTLTGRNILKIFSETKGAPEVLLLENWALEIFLLV